MNEFTIRRVEGEEKLEIKYPLGSYAFNPSPPLPDEEEWKDVVRRRQGVTCLAAFEGDRAVATVAYTAMTQNVRGALLGMGGVWGVSTHPAARRKGYSRRLMVRLWEAMRASDKPLSCLRPFRESFYERLGYVTLPQIRKVHFAPGALAPLLKVDVPGEVEWMLSGDGYERYRAYLRQMQQRRHGMAMFDAGDVVSAQRNPLWLALAQVDGETAGLMLYNLRGERETEFNLRALRFYYRTSRARYLLLQWIARHIDQANRVDMWLPPYELPETWWADLDVRPEAPGFTPMGRVVDVAGIGGLRTGPGRLDVRVHDPLCPWNEGAWRLETVDGRLQVGPGQGASCALTIQGLSALVYGTHDPGDFVVRGWGDPSPETEAVMRQMFPPMRAYLHEVF
jgi:predicted acetyltransferase